MKLVISAIFSLLLLSAADAFIRKPDLPDLRPSFCFKNLRVYRHGQTVPDSDPCKTCECDNGRVICASALCIPVACSDGSTPVAAPGECCATSCPPPTCLDRNTGVRHPVGPINDGNNCNLCTCDPSGQIFCAHVRCASPRCPNNAAPELKPGDCCPSCPEVTCLDPDTGISYPVGPVDKNDSCLHCNCDANGFLGCIREHCPLGPCPRAVTKPGECCATCTFGCDDADGNFHEVGPVDDGNPCSTCECDIFGSIQCTLQLCAPVVCPNGVEPVTKPGDCCPTCPEPTCVDDDGNRHSVGKIESNDPCKFCECDASGEIFCAMASCGPTLCPNPIRSPDQCCPTCPPGCSKDGEWYSPGPIPDDDPCVSCTCDGESGHVMCAAVGCGPLNCVDHYTPEGQCCPVCRL